MTLPEGMSWIHAGVLAGASVAGVVLTRAVMATSVKLDFVSRPKGERWSQRPVPMGGGVAIYAVLVAGLLLCSVDLALAATLVFVLGLVDDKHNLPPKVKLAVQGVAAALVVWGPLDSGPAPLLIGDPLWLAAPVTLAWYIGMCNSVNLLDNMDGSAAGVAAVAAAFLFVLAATGATPAPAVAMAAIVTLGAALGFLFWNFPPAKVFMGDAGSLVLGFSLAGLAVRIPHEGAWGLRQLAVAGFVLGIPLFDTALVWVSRRAAHRPFLQGGRDHTTHRLVALGLSPRRTVLALYGVAAALGGIGLAIADGDVGTGVICAVVAGVLALLVGVFLGDVAVYRDTEGRALVTRSRHPALLYGVELLVDVGLLTLCWIGAYALRFGGTELPEGGPALPYYLRASAFPALPFVVGFKIGALLLFRLYRGFWRTIRFRDVLAVAKAVLVATGLVVLTAVLLFRFEDYSRIVIAIDALLAFVAVVASRSALRVLRDTFGRLSGRRQRALLLGPAGVLPLLEQALSEEGGLVLLGVLAPGGEPAAVVAAAQGRGAELILLGEPLSEDDPLITALLGAGFQVRRLGVVLE
jgi:UDP-GlcNAc:undecaprenyl-phosphate GlcNAc-1-phosphate transferase